MKPVQKAPADMSTETTHSYESHFDSIPLWEAMLGMLVAGILYAFLPQKVLLGPNWLLLIIEAIFLLPLAFTLMIGRGLPHKIIRSYIFIVLGILTLALANGIVLLILTLPNNKLGSVLLRAAALLWCSNILVFGLWYWQIDGGGPAERRQSGHQAADFMFPQQANGNSMGWAPRFLDYLFLAFTGATALSPADTYPLTRQAKSLMLIEALLSMTVVVILAGRAVNIFGS